MKDLDAQAGLEPEETPAGEDDEADEQAPRRRKLSGKKLTLFIILPVLLLGGGGAGAYFGGFADSLLAAVGVGAGASHEPAPKTSVYYDLPELLVNLNSRGKKGNFLRLRVALEVDDPEAAQQLAVILPRIIDNFQVYLRELRPDDLNGSAGLFRLKEELLVRVNTASEPIRVTDVLFKEMIVQ